MPRSTLTGSRIRERRTVKGIKQADLARRVGISPAYLNLIEHNRRRIGGKLLVDLARELETDLIALSEGAQAPLIEGLKGAAAQTLEAADTPEVERSEEFAGRFPGWASLIVAQRDRVEALEHRVDALNDRLAHDPFLADALHDLLSTVTAIRSTAGILNTDDSIDPEWRQRFHRNLYEDSQRLADGSQALVGYLDSVGKSEDALSTPMDEVEAWLAAQDYALGGVEEAQQIPQDKANLPVLNSSAARDLIENWQEQAANDAKAMPLDVVDEVLAQAGPDPSELARRCDTSLSAAMRRLATVPNDAAQDTQTRPSIGLVRSDGAGALIFRKPLDGFALPRFGAACPLLPLYQALLTPNVPIRRIVDMPGQPQRRFMAYAICEPRVPHSYDAPQIVEATMMFVPVEKAGAAGAAIPTQANVVSVPVGSTCRVCVRTACAARREPSLVAAPDA